MTTVFAEERELLKELKQQERKWKLQRWLLPIFGICILFDYPHFDESQLLRISLALLFIVRSMNQWNGDPKSKLLIKLYEEKLEQEFLEEEVEKFKQKTSQEEKIENFIQKNSQQPE